MRYKAVIFDMDGVIFDSERIVLDNWIELGKKYGLDHIEEVYRRCIGTNVTKTKEILLGHYGLDFPYEKYKQETSSMFWSKCKDGIVPLKAGIKELLDYLKANHYLIGLASSTRLGAVTKELEAAELLPYFQKLICGDMIKRSKPEPDIYLTACDGLGIRPGEAVAIEDSYNGIRSAHRAGMHTVMVPDLIEPDEEMRQTADHIFKDLYEVKNWLEA